MKKIITIVLTAVMALSLLCGCDAETFGEIVQQSLQETSPTDAEQETAEAPAPIEYTVENVTGTQIATYDKTISISYPRISGWALSEAQEKWNHEFAEFDYDGTEAEIEGEPDIDSMSYNEVTYSITEQTADRLSVLFEGGYFFSGAAHPYGYAMAYTIDMKTGEEITLSSLSEEQLRAIAKATGEGNFTIIADEPLFTPEELVPALIAEYSFFSDGTTLEDIIFDTISDTESTSGHNYFIKDGKTCIILEVNHAMGDYVLLQFDF